VILNRAAWARAGGWIANGQIWARLRAWARLRRDAWRLVRSGAFDPVWYRSVYPDVMGDAALHYLRRGRAEGRASLRVVPVPLPCLPLTDTNYRTWLGIAEAETPHVPDETGQSIREADKHCPSSSCLRRQASTIEHQAIGHPADAGFREHDEKAADQTARGISDDAVLFLPPNVLLAPGALRAMMSVLAASPDVDLVYADEDCIDAAGRRCAPWFKPVWDPILAETCDLTGGVGVARRAMLQGLGPPEGTTLHALAQATDPDRVRHIPRVLSHYPLSPHPLSLRAQRSNLVDPTHPSRRHAVPGPGIHALPSSRRARRGRQAAVRHDAERPLPLVSIIIPTRDRAALLARCVDSILHRTNHPALELLIVDNDSRDRRTARLLDRLATDQRVRVLRHPGPFNWSAMNNAAARVARGKILVLLNNDVESLHPDWLSEMVELALRPEIGVVGARLLYPDGTVQHAGMTLGPGAVATHLLRGAARDDPGHGEMLHHTRSVAAVTGACMAMRHDVFDAVGGFEETHLAVTHNDVDFCLRVRARGLRVVCTPRAELLHREAASRGMDNNPEQQARAQRERDYLLRTWGILAESDPYLSPNLTTVHGDLVLAPPSPRGTIAGEIRGNALDVSQQIRRQPGGRESRAADVQSIGQPAEPLLDRIGDGLVGADRGEQCDDIVGDLGGHVGPLASLGHGVELAPEIAQSVQVQHRPVAGG
jgi:GT2 family glycosyltransferase